MRAIRRSEIFLKYSEGFHPKPKISFDNPIPIGIESLKEELFLLVHKSVRPDQIVKALNSRLPEGVIINKYEEVLTLRSSDEKKIADYVITLLNDFFDEKLLEDFKKSNEFFISVVNHKGKVKELDLKDMIFDLKLQTSNILKLSIIGVRDKIIRPGQVLKNIFHMSDEQIKKAKVLKL